MNEVEFFDVIIIGAGAAGLMAAGHLSQNTNNNILIIEANKTAGRKIIVSGGGRCNFTNMDVEAGHFHSSNKHFMKSALKQYSQWDFINIVARRNIDYYEKKLGQLFCKNKSKDILDLLMSRIDKKVQFNYLEKVLDVHKIESGFLIKTSKNEYNCGRLIVSSGGLSLPMMGASDIGVKIAKKFGHKIIETAPALVPFTLEEKERKFTSELSGISLEVKFSVNSYSVIEDLLFTHKGLSGPASLKGSLYWYPCDTIEIDFVPNHTIDEVLRRSRKAKLQNVLNEFLPKRISDTFIPTEILKKNSSELSRFEINKLEEILKNKEFHPSGTEGYRKAEVTRGGVSTDQISSKSLESKLVNGLYFIGEVVDVTGLLGGYNFQWAWSSAMAMSRNFKPLIRD